MLLPRLLVFVFLTSLKTDKCLIKVMVLENVNAVKYTHDIKKS